MGEAIDLDRLAREISDPSATGMLWKDVGLALIERIRELEKELARYKDWIDDTTLLTSYKDIHDYIVNRMDDWRDYYG